VAPNEARNRATVYLITLLALVGSVETRALPAHGRSYSVGSAPSVARITTHLLKIPAACEPADPHSRPAALSH
jgi:hypothetical protein